MPAKKHRKVGWYEYKKDRRVVRESLPADVLDRFARDVASLMSTYFSPDEDGDMPVQVRIVDRTASESLRYQPMPHRSNKGGHDRLDVARTNASIAIDDLDRALRDVRRVAAPAKS
jgi:hypothetical protein